MRHLSKNLVIALALLAAGFLVAWLRFRPYLGTEGHYTDGVEAFEIEDAGRVRYAIWGAPEEWAGEALEQELGATLDGRVTRSPDGRWVVFSVGEPGLDMDLYVAEVVDGAPVDPRLALSLNSPADERAPSFGHGALYFASDRSGGAGGLDLYRASFDGGSFGTPERLDKSLQSTADETDPAPVPGAAAIAFSSNRPHEGRRRDHDLYLAVPADKGFEVQALGALNSPAHEREPAFTADGRGLFFASDRSGGRGGYDLYRSAMALEGWVPPVPLIGINGVGSERAPMPDPAGFEMLLRVEQSGGVQDLVRARSVELFRTPGRPVGWMDLLLLGLLLALALFAWLAKRWEQLDAVYKCFLVSLVMHLLLAMWLHQVHPDPEPVQLAGHGNRLRVRLMGDPSGVRARNAERGGEVSYERVASVETETQEPSLMREPGESRELEEARPEAASLEHASEAAPQAQAALDSAEAREVQHERQAPNTAAQEPSLAALPNTQSAREGAAPVMGLEAAVESVALDASPGAATSATPAERQASQRALAEAQPAAGEARREVRLADAGDAAREAAELTDALPQESQRALTERGADLAQPMSVVQARQGGAPDMSLAGAARFDPSASVSGQTQVAPDRADQGTRRAAGQAAPDSASMRRDAAGAANGASKMAAAQEAGMQETRPEAESLERMAGVRELDSIAPERQGAPSALALDATGFEAGAQTHLATGTPTRNATESQSSVGEAFPSESQAERVAGQAGAPQVLEAQTLATASQREAFAPKMATGLLESFEPMRQDQASPLELLVAADAGLASSERESVQEAPTRLAQGSGSRELAGAAMPVSAAATLQRPRPGAGASAPAPAFSASKTLANLGGPERPRGPDLMALATPEAMATPVAEPLPERSLASAPSAAAGLDRPRAGATPGPKRLGGTPQISPLEGPSPDFRPMSLTASLEPTLVADAPAEQGGDWERTPYQSRAGQQKIEALETHGGTEETEQAVARGLAYLAAVQRDEGYWGSIDDEHEKYRHVVIGKTGLSLLAFLGAGHTHQSDTEYSEQVAKALRFLLAVQYERSGHFGESSSYGHAIASYAIGECLALTGDDVLREPLERAVAHILSKQMHSSDTRLDGGWGYYFPDSEIFDRWPRASVTAWQVMALESAQLGGLDIPSVAFDDARSFLRRCWDGRRAAFRYSHDPDRLSGPYQILPGSTPASLFALSLLGDDIAQPNYRQALNFVTERMPNGYRCRNTDRFVNQAEGNLYFWYYGTLSLFRLGGRRWEAWNEAMKTTLLPAQLEDGSWEPVSIYATDYAGDDRRDHSYSTAMCVLSLEVYYRYFTPLLKVK